MPDTELLNTLVKLAAAGTSGICVLAIAACTWIMLRLPAETPKAKHTTLRFYMVMCLTTALLSAATTFGAGYWDYKKVAALKTQNAQLSLNLTNSVQKTMELATNLESVKREKVELVKTADMAKTEANMVARRVDELAQKNIKLDQDLASAKAEVAAYGAVGLNPEAVRSIVKDYKQLQTNLSVLREENFSLKRKLSVNPAILTPPPRLGTPPH